MPFFNRGVGTSLAGPSIAKLCRRTISSTSEQYPVHIGSGQYQEGDRVLASYKDAGKVKHRLLHPLKTGGTTRTSHPKYELNHNDIIGKPNSRLYVNPVNVSSSEQLKTAWRITQPTFDDFVSLAPRSVTPIYASYAARMVDLLDLHVSPPHSSNDPLTSGVPPLEILEAGTGHGSLTIHLSRAIAAANPSPPITKHIGDHKNVDEVWNEWRVSRRAVLHTVEYDRLRSNETAGLIRSFRGGLYWPNVDFHSGDVSEWVRKEQETRQQHAIAKGNAPDLAKEFLDIVVLDLPSVEDKLEAVIHAMKDDAQLLVYAPQLTQIIACQSAVKHQNHPLVLDQVLELGEGISNGRVWDLRFVTTRAEQKLPQSGPPLEGVEEAPPSENTTLDATASHADSNSFPTMVCRPMVGRFIMGGAFIALWRKRVKKPPA